MLAAASLPFQCGHGLIAAGMTRVDFFEERLVLA
jgi:hypothetical protein